MNNSLIPKKKLTVWEKIINFWKSKILKKFDNPQIEKAQNDNKSNRSNFENDLKVKIEYDDYKLKQFIKEIENNPNLINDLSNDRLDKIIEYYEKVIEEKEKKIEKLLVS